MKLPFAALWVSPFRPFCAFGMAIGVGLMAWWVAVLAGFAALPHGALPPKLVHAHEMWFGFAMSIICASVLTALPGWARTPELQGRRLALLVALWLLGRLAFGLHPWLPPPWVALGGIALPLALFAVLTPQLWPLENRWYRLLLPILAAIAVAEALFASGAQETGLRLMFHAVLLVFTLKAGVLAPVFTGNHLRATGRGDQAPFLLPLEAAAVGSIVLLSAAELTGAPKSWQAAAAALACVVHAVRLARWRGWRVLDAPLLWMMHAAYAWMVLSFGLLAAGALGVEAAGRAALHAFTVGALGSMMLGLMTRVALRHTGRPLAVSAPMRVAFACLQAAALVRLAADALPGGAALASVAGIIWVLAFVIYLGSFGAVLFSPSLPRSGSAALAATLPSQGR